MQTQFIGLNVLTSPRDEIEAAEMACKSSKEAHGLLHTTILLLHTCP